MRGRLTALNQMGIVVGIFAALLMDYVVANAAGGFVVGGLAREMNHGIAMAREQLDNGKALAKLRALQSFKAEET